jgi:hypothetical protein
MFCAMPAADSGLPARFHQIGDRERAHGLGFVVHVDRAAGPAADGIGVRQRVDLNQNRGRIRLRARNTYAAASTTPASVTPAIRRQRRRNTVV